MTQILAFGKNLSSDCARSSVVVCLSRKITRPRIFVWSGLEFEDNVSRRYGAVTVRPIKHYERPGRRKLSREECSRIGSREKIFQNAERYYLSEDISIASTLI